LNLSLPGDIPDLVTRTQERANDFYRVLYQGVDYLHKRYGDSIPDFIPGSQIREVVWYDLGAGYRTEIIRGPKKEPVPQLDPIFLNGQTLLNTQIQSNYSNLHVQDTRYCCRLVVAVRASDTLLYVDGTALFPPSGAGNYVVQIDQEQMQVNTSSIADAQPGVLAIVNRGYNGTQQVAHSDNAFVCLTLPLPVSSSPYFSLITHLASPMTATTTAMVIPGFTGLASSLPNWPTYGRFVVGVTTGSVTEYMLVTDGMSAISGAPATVTLTVTRALLGSVAAQHNSADVVTLITPGDVPTVQRLIFDGEAHIQDGIDNQGRRVAIHKEVSQQVELIALSTDINWVGFWDAWLLKYNPYLNRLERDRMIKFVDPQTLPIV
jgi:hypothetical protein